MCFFVEYVRGWATCGEKWLDGRDERIEKNIVQVCFCEGVMLSTACDVCLRRRCGVVLNVGVGDMGQKAKPEGCECIGHSKRWYLKGAMRTPFESRRGKPEGCGTLLLECTIF